MRINSACGYSVVGLLVTIAITTILLGIGIPSMAGLVQSNRLTAQLNEFRTTLNYARIEAIQRNQDVVVCKSRDLQHCSTEYDWHDGWIVFIDTDNDHHYSEADTLLRTHGALPAGLQVHYHGSGFSHHVVFRGMGSASTNGTFRFCDSTNAANARALVINLAGRIRVGTTLPDGNAIVCS